MAKEKFLQSSIGKKFLMGITGLFLISFLVIHCFVNSLIFFNDGGITFNMGAHFMGHNWIIRSMEIVLFLGILLHIYMALVLTLNNSKARPVKYSAYKGGNNSRWYSRWMGLLGTLILMFLIIHLKHFWVVSRFTGIPTMDALQQEDLFQVMKVTFTELWIVIVYCLGMFSLAYHLLHGFKSAFQTLGLNHKKYTPVIHKLGIAFSIIVPLLFAAMPVALYMGWIK